MKFTKILTQCTVTTLVCFGLTALADEEEKLSGYSFIESDWFSSGAAIQDLRERSTTTFELLDANQSGSITLEEIDLTELQSDVETMNQEELRQFSRRSSAIHTKFMSWSSEVDEFEVVDTNADGVWNKDEFDARNENLQRHRLELGIQEWDTDGNNAVELHEFNSHLDELELLDENADGTVSHEEAFKSQNDRVISDVLKNKLMLDEMVWANMKALPEGSTSHSVEFKVMKRVDVEKSKE